jgi:hypothetical protein
MSTFPYHRNMTKDIKGETGKHDQKHNRTGESRSWEGLQEITVQAISSIPCNMHHRRSQDLQRGVVLSKIPDFHGQFKKKFW